MNANDFNFADYTTAELEYTMKTLERFYSAWNDVEMTLCDAKTDDMKTFLEWGDFRVAELAIKAAITNRR